MDICSAILAINPSAQVSVSGEDSINGTTNHRDAIIAIKDKYPKP